MDIGHARLVGLVDTEYRLLPVVLLVDIEHDLLVRLLDTGYGILVHLVLIGF